MYNPIDPITRSNLRNLINDLNDVRDASFDELVITDEYGINIAEAVDAHAAIERALYRTRRTMVHQWHDHKELTFLVDSKRRGYVAKAIRGEFVRSEKLFGIEYRHYDYKVWIIPAIDIANLGFAVLDEALRARGEHSAHVADGCFLGDIITTPEEWLNDIQSTQPVEVRALRELKHTRKECSKAARKAALELRALEATGETVELRTLKHEEPIKVTWAAKDSFKVEDSEGNKDVWSLKTICLHTNILDII